MRKKKLILNLLTVSPCWEKKGGYAKDSEMVSELQHYNHVRNASSNTDLRPERKILKTPFFCD